MTRICSAGFLVSVEGVKAVRAIGCLIDKIWWGVCVCLLFSRQAHTTARVQSRPLPNNPFASNFQHLPPHLYNLHPRIQYVDTTLFTLTSTQVCNDQYGRSSVRMAPSLSISIAHLGSSAFSTTWQSNASQRPLLSQLQYGLPSFELTKYRAKILLKRISCGSNVTR